MSGVGWGGGSHYNRNTSVWLHDRIFAAYLLISAPSFRRACENLVGLKSILTFKLWNYPCYSTLTIAMTSSRQTQQQLFNQPSVKTTCKSGINVLSELLVMQTFAFSLQIDFSASTLICHTCCNDAHTHFSWEMRSFGCICFWFICKIKWFR